MTGVSSLKLGLDSRHRRDERGTGHCWRVGWHTLELRFLKEHVRCCQKVQWHHCHLFDDLYSSFLPQNISVPVFTVQVNG